MTQSHSGWLEWNSLILRRAGRRRRKNHLMCCQPPVTSQLGRQLSLSHNLSAAARWLMKDTSSSQTDVLKQQEQQWGWANVGCGGRFESLWHVGVRINACWKKYLPTKSRFGRLASLILTKLWTGSSNLNPEPSLIHLTGPWYRAPWVDRSWKPQWSQ